MAVEHDTKSKMIDAAIKMMEQGGESAIRVAQITESLGLTQPAIYSHFASRQELVTAAYAEWYRRALVTGVDPSLTVRDVNTREEYMAALRANLEWSFQPDRHEARQIRISVLGAAQTNSDLRDAVNEVNRQFLDLVTQATRTAQERGWVRKDFDPAAIAYWLNGQITGRVVAEMDPGQVDLNEWDKVSFDAVFKLLTAD